ncbi:cardiac-enriched FHL2-interacting protein isoform X2 [Larimichthys crocea]|uniref:cardiac-enriched FHL2-interacting protein isoform X2 n=1 Tax=Larimichthys crocea TaxID=215358 RepID=UPI000F5F9F87|nr:titin homolog isoform X2 [Larimichthys crocea]
MTSVEKRRSGRKSGGHRKHSDGGYSDTSSGGSFLDETDREVSNLTDRAFRSLCIGDEAVYNDSDLCSSSPCSQRDRQLAFSQSGQERGREDREREELKRAAHESFSFRMQQYGQEWIHGGMYGAEIQRDPQWEVYGERTQGRVSATFQHSFVENSQQGESLMEEQLSFLSNGATELSSQQRRSRSRVSSLIRAFNSEGHRDGAGMDGKLRDWNDETSWDKSALMSIQRELSEFSTPYQQSFNSGYYPSAGPYSSQEANLYASEVAAVAHMNSASSFMSSSHSKHSMSTQVNCNSNFFIHSEFSPFKVWRDHNRFPFQQGQVSGFMHCSEFPRWYETPMYKELSLEAQPQGPYRFEERGNRHPRNNLAPVVPPTPSRSTSTSTMLQKALAVEKRCESELAGHYPHRKRTQSLGTNRLPSQRPSTASPTIEMSRRVQDTISSVKALQQKIKMMTEQNITTEMTANQQGVLYNNDNLIPFGNNAQTVAPASYNISQPHAPLVHAHQEVERSELQQYAVSPQPMEHPPVRAESRGANPDVRMSSYKSRATSLLFNLKDNRKRVKSTYSPPKFKGLEIPEKNKQPLLQEPRDTVIDIPEFPDPDIQFSQVEASSRANAASHQYVNQYHNPGLPLATLNSQPATAYTGQYSEYTSSDYQTAQMQGEIVHHSGFTGLIPENYASNQLANGQNLHEDLSSFPPYKQGMIDNVQTLGGDTFKPSYTATEIQRIYSDNNQAREYLISKANTEQHFNETVGREFTKVDRYQQLKENQHDYSNVSSQDRWGQTNSQDTENISLKAAISPWKQETTALIEKDQHPQAYQRAAARKEELSLPRDKYREENQQNKELEKTESRESFGVGTCHKKAGLVNPNISNQLPQYAPFSNDTVENPKDFGQQQPKAFKDKQVLPKSYGYNKENETKDNYLTQNYNRYADHDKTMLMQETGQRKQMPKGHEIQSLQSIEAKPQLEHNKTKMSLSDFDNASAPTIANRVEHRQFAEVKAEQAMAEHIKAQHAQAELAKAQHWAQVEQPKVESAGLILTGQTGSEKVKAEQSKAEITEHERVAKAEHIEPPEQYGEKQSDQTSEEQTKAEQTRSQKVTEKPKNNTEEAGDEHMRGVQEKQVKVEQVEAERLKEEHIKTDLTKTEQASIKQAITEQARGGRIKAEQLKEEEARAKQVEREQIEAERIRTEKVKAEQAEAERRDKEQAKLKQLKEQQAKAEQEKTKVVDSIDAGQINAKQPITQISNVKEEKVTDRNPEQAKLEQTKVELAKAEQTKTENMQERSANCAAKLTATQQVKSEPDRVEQVKTELAKAKAELAKIKEKMRGEQKVKNAVCTKVDGITKGSPLRVNLNKNEEDKDQDQAKQTHKQKEDSVVVQRQSVDNAIRGANDYTCLREKYGFTDTALTEGNKPAENVSSNDASDTPSVILDKVETTKTEKSKDRHSPTNRFATANTENKVDVGSFKSNQVTESHYVYSESSKEFKLSGADHLPSNVDRANSDAATNKMKDDSVEKLERCDPPKNTDVSQQADFGLAKTTPLERKPKSTEHSVGPSKDPHFTPTKAMSHKERAQTKQEILTSKIKAHAEKEISAIKEKGFAKRDGFISKTSTKLLGSQAINIRQRPPSQEVSKKQESTMSSNTTPKNHMELSGIQMEPVKSVSDPSSAAIPVKSVATTSQLVDHSQKQVPKDPTKSKDNVPTPREGKQAESYTMSTDEGLVENQKKVNESGIKSPMQSKEEVPKNKQGQQEENYEISGKQKERLKDTRNKEKEDPPQATALVKTESSKPVMTEKAKNKHETCHKDTVPSLNLVLGQNETPVADDSLQITGIMVTVRERKPSVNNGQRNTEETESNTSKIDKCHPSSGLEVSKGSKSSMDVSSKIGMNNHPETMQEISTLETRQNNVPENVKRINLQHASTSTNTKSQRETQLQEPQAEKAVPSAVTVPTKNKVPAEPLLYKQDTIARESKENSAKSIKKGEAQSNTEEKNPQGQKAHSNETFMAKAVNTGINHTNNSNKSDAKTLIMHDIKPSLKEDMTTVINPSKIISIDAKNAPLLEEKRCDSTPAKPLNKTNPSNHLTQNDVHIGSISIRVVPAVTEKDNLKTEGKHHVTTVPSGLVAGNEHTQVASSNHEKKVDTNKEDIKDLTPASCEKQMKDNLEDKLGVQHVWSSVKKLPDSLKISNQQNSVNTTSENTQAEDGKPEKAKSGKSVDESKIQPMEGDYFQVQRIAETKNEPHNSVNIGDTSNAVLKGREPPGLVPNKTTIRNESCNEEKSVFVLDQSKIKTVESSSVSVQDEITKRKNREKEDNLASNQRDGSTERRSNKNEKTEAGQTTHIRKHTHSTQHTENQSSISARERQSSNSSHPARENTVEPEVKPKPKEKVSTIPEITALADYARLKVIASEDRANTIQEFPPNKKEGFFPLIQTHHSRRPVFTADPKDLSVKEKSLPNKTEVNSKVNKEPKPLVFPITEKEHQRTGMFKLGDKERQEKMRSDAKTSEDVLDPGVKHSQHLKERDKSPTTHLKNQGSEKQVAGTDIQRVSQVIQSIPSHPPPTTCSEVNKPRNTSVSQHIKRLEAYTTENSKQTKLRKDENTENALKQNRPEKLRQERLITHHEETMAKQSFAEQEQLEEEQTSRVEVDRRAEDIKIKHIIEESRASQAEEERRATQREEERRAREREAIAIQIKERREKQREAERRAEEERNRLAKQTEEKITAQKEEEMRAKQREEEQIKEKEKMLKQQEEERAAQEEQQRRAAVIEVQQKRAAQEEQQRRAALVEEQKRRVAQEEQKRRAAQEEQQRRAAQEEQHRRAAQEEQQRRAAQEEEQRRAALIEEQQRRAAQEEQQRRAALVEEQKKRAAQEEQQRRAALIEEQKKRAAQEEQQRRAALIEEQKRRAAQEEQQRRAVQEEKQKKAAQEEQQRRAALEEQQKRAALEEQQRRAAQEEQQRRAAQEEQQRRAAQEEQQRQAAQEEQLKRAAQKEQQRRAAQEEQQKIAALIEEQKRRATQEEQRQAKQDEEILANIEKEKKRKQREEEKAAKIPEEEKIKQAQDHQIKEHRGERQKREELMSTQRENDERRAVQIEKTIIKQRDEKQTKEKMARLLEESQAALKKEEKKVAQERMLAQRNNEISSIKRGEEEKLAVYGEKERADQMEEQKRAAQSVDSLQYYAITSTESERKPRERQLSSPSPSQQRNNSSGFESTEDSHTRAYRPHAPASPAPALPRSNTSSPALGTKPLMFRVKDNTNRGPFFTKSVKPRFHKNFGEDFRVGSPMGSERGEEEQETLRRSALTPLHSDTGLNRLAAIKESSTFQSASSSQDYSAPLPHHRPYSRRSIALDEDDSRSVISNMSEDVESFATSAADLADIRGLYDYERPESACSFSSDVSRSLGRPPVVPPKSEKALRRAKRLTTRRIKKELSKAVADSPVEVEKPFQEDSSIPSSSSIEVCSSKLHAVASPHFSPPVSLAHAPTVGSSLPSSNTEHQSSHSSFYASPHATGPISLPTASPHATAPISLPVASPHATGPVSHAVAPKIVADVPSSPTLHHANHPAPVTQYHVESNYPQSYPLTQRKVLQDLGSGQYFVVDVPVEVKKKTFFDPETGKYVQLNVRESAKSTSRPQPQQTYLQPQLQPQVHVNTQQQRLTQDSPAGKPLVLYQGYHGYPQGYQTAAMNSVPNNRSSAPVTLHQDQQPVMDSHSYGYPAPEIGQNSEGHRYSPEKTPYMDTVNDTDKTHNTVYNTHGPYESLPECDTNSQLAGSSVCQNDSSAHSRYQPRDIITMSELEDFMELSDW